MLLFIFQTPKKTVFPLCCDCVVVCDFPQHWSLFSSSHTDEILAGGMGLDDDEQNVFSQIFNSEKWLDIILEETVSGVPLSK